MKTFTSQVTPWLILFAFLLNANYLFADAWYKHRRCNWIYEEWKTRAWVDYKPTRGGPHINVEYDCNDRDKSCTFAESDCYWGVPYRTQAYAVGGDRVVKKTDGLFTVTLYDFGEAVHKVVSTCLPGPSIVGTGDCYGNNAAGFNRVALPADKTSYHVTRPFLDGPVQNSSGYISTVNEKSIYDEVNHTITVKNLKGILEMNALDVANDFTAFTISVTHEPESYVESEDPYKEEEAYMQNLIWSSTAMLNNGRVLMDGAFRSSLFKVTKNDGPQSEVSVELNIEELVIQIPENISLDEVSVNFGVDGGNLGYGISEKFMVDNPTDELTINPFFVPEEEFTFENYPNAVSDILNIKLKLPQSTKTTLLLLDINGNTIKQIYRGGIGANREFILEEDVSNLKEGVYLLVVELQSHSLVRKVIVKH